MSAGFSLRTLRLRTLAKINLDLRVLRKREDGFHEIRTVFHTISLSDRLEIEFEPAEDVSIHVGGNVEIEDNLIARAARLVLAETGRGGRLRVKLVKRIPMGAGLGGGSSDAAAIFLSLPRLLNVRIPFERLHALAATLGSDVPFFLHGGAAVGAGRGEELYPLPDFAPCAGLLVTPDIHVSTPEAYGRLAPFLGDDQIGAKQSQFARFAWEHDWAECRNDFETPVFAKHPELAAMRAALAEGGVLCARMSGSGSSVFALFPDAQSRSAARRRTRGYRSFPFTLVTRARYRKLWERQLSAGMVGS